MQLTTWSGTWTSSSLGLELSSSTPLCWAKGRTNCQSGTTSHRSGTLYAERDSCIIWKNRPRKRHNMQNWILLYLFYNNQTNCPDIELVSQNSCELDVVPCCSSCWWILFVAPRYHPATATPKLYWRWFWRFTSLPSKDKIVKLLTWFKWMVDCCLVTA